jgi:hypothetical protein
LNRAATIFTTLSVGFRIGSSASYHESLVASEQRKPQNTVEASAFKDVELHLGARPALLILLHDKMPVDVVGLRLVPDVPFSLKQLPGTRCYFRQPLLPRVDVCWEE